MRRRTILACTALAAAVTISATGAALAAGNNSGFKTGQPSMLTAVKTGCGDHAAPDRRGRASERLSIRGHPGRDLRAHPGSGKSRPLREPRDQQGAVPVQHGGAHRSQRGERFRQRAGEPTDPQPALGRGAQRLVRHLEQLRLPALLLQLPRHERRRASAGRSSSRTRSHPTTCIRQEASWPPTPGSPAEREAGLVVALDVRTGKHHPIYGMGRHNHENNVAIPGYGDPVVLSGDDTFTSGPLTGSVPHP